jgi:ABC-type phosphate transport system auxiliary subunit
MKSLKFGCNLEDVDSALERLNQQKFELEVRYPVPLDCGELEARREELKKQLKQATQGGDQAKEKRLRVTLAELQEEIDSRQRASDRRSVPMAPVRAEMRWFNDEKRRLSRTLGNW